MEEAVVSILFTFLADNRTKDGDKSGLVAAVGGEEGLCDGQDAESHIRKGLGKSDRIIEIVDREVIFAGLDGGIFGVGEDTVSGEGMDCFLLNVEVSKTFN